MRGMIAVLSSDDKHGIPTLILKTVINGKLRLKDKRKNTLKSLKEKGKKYLEGAKQRPGHFVQ